LFHRCIKHEGTIEPSRHLLLASFYNNCQFNPSLTIHRIMIVHTLWRGDSFAPYCGQHRDNTIEMAEMISITSVFSAVYSPIFPAQTKCLPRLRILLDVGDEGRQCPCTVASSQPLRNNRNRQSRSSNWRKGEKTPQTWLRAERLAQVASQEGLQPLLLA
jgi:hypothetical protein